VGETLNPTPNLTLLHSITPNSVLLIANFKQLTDVFKNEARTHLHSRKSLGSVVLSRTGIMLFSEAQAKSKCLVDAVSCIICSRLNN